jgi:hypothetical protein
MCPTFVGQVAGSFVACNQELRAFGKPSDLTALGGWPVEPSVSGGTEGSLGDDFDARQSKRGRQRRDGRHVTGFTCFKHRRRPYALKVLSFGSICSLSGDDSQAPPQSRESTLLLLLLLPLLLLLLGCYAEAMIRRGLNGSLPCNASPKVLFLTRRSQLMPLAAIPWLVSYS